MSEENSTFDKRLYRVIAHNCKLAREIAGLSRIEAQNAIWQYKNDKMFPNRISELESGDKKIELKTIYKLCEVYGCSPEFIFGFSDEFELHNMAAKHSGMVLQSVRGAVLEAAEQICMNVSKSITHLPPFQGEMLKSSARKAVDIFDTHSHDLVFKSQYGDVLEVMKDLKKNVAMFEMFFAKQMRQMELSMMSLLQDGDDDEASMKLTKHVELRKPEKV